MKVVEAGRPIRCVRRVGEAHALMRAWDRFASAGEIDAAAVAPAVAEAWLRSREHGIDPGLPRAPYAPVDLAEAKRTNDWLECCGPVLELLRANLPEPHQLILLGDASGRILSAHGGRRAMARAEELRGVPGGEWGESHVGCSILGSSLATKGPMQLLWSENFCEAWKDWANHSAPIHEPFTNDVVGVLGIAGYRELCHSRGLDLVVRSVALIEEAVRARDLARRARVLEELVRCFARYPTSPLLGVDRRGLVIAASPSVAKTTALREGGVLGRVFGDVAALRELFGEVRFTDGDISAPELDPSQVVVLADGESAIGAVLIARSSRRPREPARGWAAKHEFSHLLGASAVIREAKELARRASQTDWPVLLLGESGTGKEVLAHAIHNASGRAAGPFVAFSCAAVSDEIMSAELFGYEEGSFTGASRGGKLGKLQIADGGTLFLDDIDAMPAKMQAALLRVLEDGSVVAVGALRPTPVDVRIIAASNHDPQGLMEANRLRSDLYYRLSVLTLTLPALRDRREDIPILANHLLGRLSPGVSLSGQAREALKEHEWPGNVRELRNVLLQLGLRVAPRAVIEAEDVRALWGRAASAAAPNPIAAEDERASLHRVMRDAGNMRQAAVLLNVHPSTLYRKLKRFGIEPEMTWRRRRAD